jgi:hypothetical protein
MDGVGLLEEASLRVLLDFPLAEVSYTLKPENNESCYGRT